MHADDTAASLPSIALSPARVLHLHAAADAPTLPAVVRKRIAEAFAADAGAGLLHLGAAEVGTVLPQPFAWWRDFAVRYVTELRRAVAHAEATGVAGEAGEGAAAAVLPEVEPPGELDALIASAPPFLGAEYLDAATLLALWRAMAEAAAARTDAAGVTAWLAAQHASWQAVGRVHLHLAELKGDEERPFAFVATFTARLSGAARPQHVQLGKAVQRAATTGDRAELLRLLAPVQRAAERCGWLAAKLEAGELYRPSRWTAAEALALLRDVPTLEEAGVQVRMPASWVRGRPPRARVHATLDTGPGGIDAKVLLRFDPRVCVDGEPLTEAELSALLQSDPGLVLLRGRWVEVDTERLASTLQRFEAAQAQSEADGIGLHAAMRLLSGVTAVEQGEDEQAQAWTEVVAGPELAARLRELRDPDGQLAAVDPGPALLATLRPYQARGVAWLHLLVRLGLGGCLADDMGLGKTLQVLALLLVMRQQGRLGEAEPALVVVPASLLGNWQAEAARFAPSLRLLVAHRAARPESVWTPELAADVVLTTYGTLARDERLRARAWGLCVLDEAQAIKNPGTRQAKAAKAVRAGARIAMTGTPVENRLGDLWSLMDFLDPGLLGRAPEFKRLCDRLADRGDYAPLRKLVQPYLLRRRKTDKAVISDLPDKTELRTDCGLSKKQAALYEQAVQGLEQALRDASDIARRGAVLAALLSFKQICNHPAHWLGGDDWNPAESGKLRRLLELVETVAQRGEKMLVFTQFREATGPLADILTAAFGAPGLVLHGGTPVRKRAALVERFQTDPEVPFFVLSLKAGGTGLNLTAASHVVHFDRWWNPAVEDQATDRAFRIGQRRNVLVHKFVCRGTVEERIDALIQSKRALAEEALGGAAEVRLTELSDAELLATVALDLRAARAAAD
ncbi:MAG: DEAD/DEAH box helicase [Deltaproteobacteria bacterium]|nr:DEAD/DEAH box helicase [Deltaproteobacteria bacterium]